MKAYSIAHALRSMQAAHWFLNGFAAARPATMDEGNGSHTHLQGALSDVGEWLAAIVDGSRRIIAPGQMDIDQSKQGMTTTVQRDDGGLIVITYAELEKMMDGLRGRPSRQDQALAVTTVRAILAEVQAEESAYRYDDNIPF